MNMCHGCALYLRILHTAQDNLKPRNRFREPVLQQLLHYLG